MARAIEQAKGVALAQDRELGVSLCASVIGIIRTGGPWKRQSQARASAGPVDPQSARKDTLNRSAPRSRTPLGEAVQSEQ